MLITFQSHKYELNDAVMHISELCAWQYPSWLYTWLILNPYPNPTVTLILTMYMYILRYSTVNHSPSRNLALFQSRA